MVGFLGPNGYVHFLLIPFLIFLLFPLVNLFVFLRDRRKESLIIAATGAVVKITGVFRLHFFMFFGGFVVSPLF